ncbi:MAG: type II toxin-antitoxin system HicB family antitoxin [Tannerellaceae bacterium]|jgi:predicted RNase H-like HicB family nuclease|nr:type II toxin-antitoxin system HicB family antitoxin [Tannerellaceae bacterium]
MKYTMVVNKGQNGFLIGQLKELPEVFTQGESVEELKENIADALEMYLEDMRENYRSNGRRTLIPRHADIDNDLCALICKQLGIPKPSMS